MDKPIFPIIAGEELPSKEPDSEILRDLSAGKYDELFQNEEFRLSDLYRAAQNHPPSPSVRLVSIVPPQPAVFGLPEYPALARLARIEGAVRFKIVVDTNGTATGPIFEGGHPLLRAAVKNAVDGWKFPPDGTTYEVQATIEFALNCPKAPDKR
jgi:TonB family protein